MHEKRTMNARRIDDERKRHALIHRTEGEQRLMDYWIQTAHFRPALSERRSLAISRMEVRLNANSTESFTTERKCNETECKHNETATRRNKRNATWTFFNTNGHGVERKPNGNFTWAFIDIQIVEICSRGHLYILWLWFCTLFGSFFCTLFGVGCLTDDWL